MNNIRTAIMKAAGSIEQNPDIFSFGSIKCPDPDCGTPGCAIGWMGFHMGMEGLSSMELFTRVNSSLGINGIGIEFYGRMDAVFGGHKWKHSATNCAKALRLYADKFHPSVIPDNVIQLFSAEAPSPSLEGLSLPCALQTRSQG